MRHAVLNAGVGPVFRHVGEHLRHVDFRRVLPCRLEALVDGGGYHIAGGVHFAVFRKPAGKLLALRRRKGAFGECVAIICYDPHGLHRAGAAVGVKGDGDEVLDRERGGHDELAVLVRVHLVSLLSVDGDLHGFAVGKVVAALRGEQEVQRVALALLKRAGVHRHAAADSPVGTLNDILRTGIGRHRGICRALVLNRTLHREGSAVDDVSGGHRGLERKRHLADLGVSGVVLVGDLLDSGVIERQDVPTVDLADRAAGPVARAGGREVCALRRAVARQVGIDLILEVPVDLDVVDVARAVHLRRIERRVAAQVERGEIVPAAVQLGELWALAQVEHGELVSTAVQIPERVAPRVEPQIGELVYAAVEPFHSRVQLQIECFQFLASAIEILHIFQVLDAPETRDGVAVAEHLLDVILADVEHFDLPGLLISQDRAAGDLAHVFPEYRVWELPFVDRRAAACRACRERQQAEHHDQAQEDAENAFFHLFPPP